MATCYYRTEFVKPIVADFKLKELNMEALIKKNIYAIVFSILASTASSQVICIPMTAKNGSNNRVMSYYKPTKQMNNTDGIKGLDTSNCNAWQLRKAVLFVEQEMRERKESGKMSDTHFQNYVRDNAVDTNRTRKQAIPKNSVYAFIKLDKHKTKFLKVDTNNDRNFSDEEWFIFPMDSAKRKPTVIIDFEYFKDGELKLAKVPFAIDIFENNGDELNFYFINQSYWEGQIELDGVDHIVQLDEINYGLYPNKDFLINIIKVNGSRSENVNYKYRSSESVILGNRKLFSVDSFKDGQLCFDYEKQLTHDNAKLNTQAPPISTSEEITGKEFSLFQRRGKYVLLDFWGTWCQPCLKAIPSLAKMAEKYGNELAIVSIAYDKRADYNKFLDQIQKNKMNWEHIFVDFGSKSTIMNDYLVQEFPTTILINPDGKIVVREKGEESLLAIEKFLNSIKKQ